MMDLSALEVTLNQTDLEIRDDGGGPLNCEVEAEQEHSIQEG